MQWIRPVLGLIICIIVIRGGIDIIRDAKSNTSHEIVAA
jgi:divalent metal cation (Fe/Co/Zn/Cd) transporter